MVKKIHKKTMIDFHKSPKKGHTPPTKADIKAAKANKKKVGKKHIPKVPVRRNQWKAVEALRHALEFIGNTITHIGKTAYNAIVLRKYVSVEKIQGKFLEFTFMEYKTPKLIDKKLKPIISEEKKRAFLKKIQDSKAMWQTVATSEAIYQPVTGYINEYSKEASSNKYDSWCSAQFEKDHIRRGSKIKIVDGKKSFRGENPLVQMEEKKYVQSQLNTFDKAFKEEKNWNKVAQALTTQTIPNACFMSIKGDGMLNMVQQKDRRLGVKEKQPVDVTLKIIRDPKTKKITKIHYIGKFEATAGEMTTTGEDQVFEEIGRIKTKMEFDVTLNDKGEAVISNLQSES